MAITAAAGSASADSYASLATADSYLADDRLDASTWAALTDAVKEAALKMATQQIDRLTYKGSRVDEVQALNWPRYPVYRDGILLASDEIPADIEKACIELAFWLSGADRTTRPGNAELTEVKVGGIGVKFRNPDGEGGLLEQLPDIVVGFLQRYITGSFRGSGSYPVTRV